MAGGGEEELPASLDLFLGGGDNAIKATQAQGRHLGGAVGAKALEGRPG